MSIATDPSFIGRVYYCMEKAAVAVSTEDPLTLNHTARVTFAEKILSGTQQPQIYSVGVVTNPTIALEANASQPPDFGIPDADIEFTVNSLFDSFAGVTK